MNNEGLPSMLCFFTARGQAKVSRKISLFREFKILMNNEGLPPMLYFLYSEGTSQS
jgi:hypothetical protein